MIFTCQIDADKLKIRESVKIWDPQKIADS